jgi:PKD repeat protein
MDSKTKIVLRIAAFFMLYSTLFSGVKAMSPDSTISASCTNYGMAYAPYSDECYFYIILDNGVLVQPVPESIPEILFPSGPTRVKVGYDIIDSVSSACGTGFLAYLTCIEIIRDSTACMAFFTYEKIRCDSLFNSIRCGDYSYRFSNYSSGNAIAWHWDFGDGTGSTEFEPVHDFLEAGVYEVCLTITTSDSCSSQYCITLDVGAVPECMAMFSYFSPVNCIGDSDKCLGSTIIQFMDYSYGNISEWHWDFGDGTTSNEQNPMHEFPGLNEYMVCLTINSADSCTNTYCLWVDLRQPDCHAYFDYCNYSSLLNRDILPPDTIPSDSTLSGNYSLVGFRNLSEGQADSFWWDFGDGSFSREENPVHVYTSPGSYTVCLQINLDSGCNDEYCATVNVGAMECSVDFTYKIDYLFCGDLRPVYMFIPALDGPTSSIYWDFGDGNYSYDEVAAHVYEQSGVYNVCIEVFYANNCYVALCKNIEVSEDEQDSVWYYKCDPNAIPTTKTENELSVKEAYPNPVSNMLNLVLNSPSTSEIRISLVNILGQARMLSSSYYTIVEGENHLELDLSGIEAGTYIYLIYSDNDMLHGRINIIR